MKKIIKVIKKTEKKSEKMKGRTDLAVEKQTKKDENLRVFETSKENLKITTVKISRENKKEEYITVEFPSLLTAESTEKIEKEILSALKKIIPKNIEKVLVAGLGNREITCDSIGPFVCERVLATRHLNAKILNEIGIKRVKNVSVLAPGVLGKTGIEAVETIEAVSKKTKAEAVIVIDALAASSIKRLFKAIQVSNAGISPGSGVKNERKEISLKTLGIPVFAIGVPTVVDAENLAEELTNSAVLENADLILTPKDADVLCKKVSEIIARAINMFLHSEEHIKTVMELV